MGADRVKWMLAKEIAREILGISFPERLPAADLYEAVEQFGFNWTDWGWCNCYSEAFEQDDETA